MRETNIKQTETKGALNRCLGLKETITITVGTVIGVGLFTVGASVVGNLGAGVIFATLLALLVSIYPSLLYAEMGAALPGAGGTYQYATAAFGRPVGILAGLHFIISMVAVTSGEAMAFSFYFRTLLDALHIPLPISDTTVAVIVIALFILLAIAGVEMTGRMQNAFMFFFWGVTFVWLCTMIPHLQLTHFSSSFLQETSISAILPCVAMVWWCFAGFETCCAMGEEIKYPQINLPRALKLAPFLVFSVNALFQWVLVNIVPPSQLSLLVDAAAPYAEGMRLAGVLGFPLILLCLGIAFGGDFSTLNAGITAPARYLYTMAREGAFPKIFATLHPKRNTPIVAIFTLGAVIISLIITNSLIYVASLSLFSTLLYYIIGMASALKLRYKYPNLKRPYKAKGIVVGAPISILFFTVMMTQLEKNAIISGVILTFLGLAIVFFNKKVKKPKETITNYPLISPGKEERIKMDKEYLIWKVITTIVTVFTVGLFVFSFLVGSF